MMNLKAENMKALILTILLGFAGLACAESPKSGTTAEKAPASKATCADCEAFVSKGKEIVSSQLSEDERAFQPENRAVFKKQSEARKMIADHIHDFLKNQKLSDPSVMDAVFEVWMMVTEYEQIGEVAQKNFEYFLPELENLYARLSQKSKQTKSDEEKKLYQRMRLSLASAESEHKGDVEN